ncbi:MULTISPECIES: GerAB/ArcD/ProY family transporter [Paenibacillus]|uniref:GerAB/ArcD/ProY family transporter n=1 Tax=Paenibacillus violae TaxID=3077234 RepID=A0ABU3RP87_9BACL|nr:MULTISPECIES: GerAB/ArcD/ProY family transporter [Paenibacillus]MDU0206033.1 GerAB/ArcD/ProY family transporter [Paenibacillus sp. PFR10]MEC0269520.1 GerAB/ArcD/ProY family transporter [Paenibacillus anseongense]
MIHLKKLSLTQLFNLIILTQVGVSVLSIPFAESKHSGYDSWISVFIGGVIAQAIITIIYCLSARYADRALPQYMNNIVGKVMGSILNMVIGLYCAESSLMVIVSYSDVLSRWVLIRTPWLVLVGIAVGIAAFIASSSLRSIAVITQNIMIMFFIAMVIIFISGIGKGDIRHFFPIGSHGMGAIMKDALPAFWAYAGYELLLYVFPTLSYRKKKDVFLVMTAANGCTTLFYMLISIIVTFNFSENQLRVIPEPMVFILRQFKWPVVQSLDIVFMTIWLSVTTVTAYVYLFLAARYISFTFGKEKGNHAVIVWLLGIFCFGLGLFGSDRKVIFQFSNYHSFATLIVIAIIPSLLLLISITRGKVGAR